MNAWDESLNRLNDDAYLWWPIDFIRPKKHAPMTARVVLVIAVLYGVLGGMIANIVFALAGSGLARQPYILPLAVPAAWFVVHRLTLARAWNRRAARLAAHRS